MSTVSKRRTVPAGPARVWSVLADFGALAEWTTAVDHSCLLTELDRGPGTARRVQVGPQTLVEEVTVWVENEELSYSITGLPAFIGEITNTWTLSPLGSSTVVTLTTRIEARRRPVAQALAGVVVRVLARASDTMLDGLVDHLDTKGGTR
ncbi:MAG TPA: SRPBCC family protein [Microthrixaceae bacterium]|jgi:uncharacterized protein YndB with AHSA1/START domain|nr:SRPBCC family protein [Microthrixaceae bacterium]HMT59533.1 SRPBCC family protein [Microthrixaceae bacterium]